ncbi:hypothetical protein D3C80_1484690 [compost metagenome]
MGTGEGALFVTEQFGLDQLLGNRTAVDRHEGLFGAARQAVQGVGHQLLAGPALAADQHRRIGRPELAQQLAQLAHARRIAEELVFIVELLGPAQRSHAQCVPQGVQQPRAVEWQRVKIEAPFADEQAKAAVQRGARRQGGDPLRRRASQQFANRVQTRSQANQADIGLTRKRLIQGAELDCPAGVLYFENNGIEFIEKVDDKQSAQH